MAPTDPESRPGDRPPALEHLSVEPENAQVADRRVLDQLVTERGEHYVRNHYPTPDLDGDDWTISLTGAVEGELSMDALREELPTASVAHTMECSGNGRAYFEPDAAGHQWEHGAVSTAVWTGAPLDAVLDEFGVGGSSGSGDDGAGDGPEGAGVPDGERWVSVMGADAPEGEETFCRSVPTAKLREDCLLAYGMNGRPLPPEHGAPVRLLVPGWFGNNSVKWVDRLHVGREMVAGDEWEGFTRYHQHAYRLFFDEEEIEHPTEHVDVDTTDTLALQNGGEMRNGYLFEQLPKALICRPAGDDPVSAADPEPVVGVAWAGENPVESVELSTDGGETWDAVDLSPSALGRYAWRRFEHDWAPEPGEKQLVARAVDGEGRTQPARLAERDEGVTEIGDAFPWNYRGYGNNAYRPFGVSVTVE